MKLLVTFVVACVATLLAGVFTATSAQTTEPAISGLTLSGGDLASSVRIAPADEDAFMRRINSPPRLDKRPERATGTSYTLTGGYWAWLLNRPGRPETNDAALYYPDGGVVRAVQGGQDAWLALDLRQQAILERYIRLAREGLLSERPGLIEMLVATAPAEDVTLEANGGALNATQVSAVWGALVSTAPPTVSQTPQPPRNIENGYWLVFGLNEGRSLQLLYEPGNPGRLTDSFGYERYTVSPELASVLLSVRAQTHQINDPRAPGSYGWWVVLIGAGLMCFVGAYWLRNHPIRLPAAIEKQLDRFAGK